MLAAAIVVFREILEIALIVGTLLAATRGLAGRGRWIVAGLSIGVAGSVVIAIFAEFISNAASGMGQELFNATTLLCAAALIIWTVLWMKRHGRELTQKFQAIGADVSSGDRPFSVLMVVVALAVLREGSEIVLFIGGILAGGEEWRAVLSGSVLGLLLGFLAGAAIYAGLIRISPKHMFKVTGWLLVLLAAGMVSQAVNFLSSTGWVYEFGSPLWDTSALLSVRSPLGKFLSSFVGYTDRPSGSQVIAYCMVVVTMVFLLREKKRINIFK